MLARLDCWRSSSGTSAAAGGHVHWARDAAEANAVVHHPRSTVAQRDEAEIVKMKSLTTDEIELNDALAKEGIHALKTTSRS